MVSEGKTVIQQRRGNGIWKNLYQFPLIETEKEVSKTQFLKEENFLQLLILHLLFGVITSFLILFGQS